MTGADDCVGVRGVTSYVSRWQTFCSATHYSRMVVNMNVNASFPGSLGGLCVITVVIN